MKERSHLATEKTLFGAAQVFLTQPSVAWVANAQFNLCLLQNVSSLRTGTSTQNAQHPPGTNDVCGKDEGLICSK